MSKFVAPDRHPVKDLRFIHIHNEFFTTSAMREEIKAREIALFSLLFNASNRYRWPPSFEASTSMLCHSLGCKRPAFTGARARLKQCGVIDFTEGTMSKSACYWFTIGGPADAHSLPRGSQTDAVRATNGHETVTLKEDGQDNTDRVTERDSTLSNFDSIVKAVEQQFPRRDDVRDLAVRLRDHRGAFNESRLKQWVETERHPRYKSKSQAEVPEPAGWREKSAKEYPGAKIDYSWKIFQRSYPEEAARYMSE
jgi:hypothetical protein